MLASLGLVTKKWAQYHIGVLAGPRSGDLTVVRASQVSEEAIGLKSFLHNKIWKSVTLISRVPVSHDSEIFRFKLPDPSLALGLPTGQHVYVRLSEMSGALVQRAYTPLSESNCTGYVDILMKYLPNSSGATIHLLCLGCIAPVKRFQMEE
jgi:nitrate reductase (NAD(P)H)